MPRKKAENQKSDSPNDPVSDSQAVPVHSSTQNTGKEHTGRKQTTHSERNSEKSHAIDIKRIPKIDVIEGVEANRIADKANVIADSANTISKWSIAINALIFAVTAGLAIVAVHQYQAANDAATTAQNTLRETKKFDSITLENQSTDSKKADDTARAKYKREMALYKLQKTGDSTQIAALQETQKEFEIENRPFITVINTTIDTPIVGKPMAISSLIINTGKQPAIIIDMYSDFQIKTDTNYNSFNGIAKFKNAINNIMAGGGGGFPVNNHTSVVTQEEFDRNKNIPFYLYEREIIKYRYFLGNKIYETMLIYRVSIDRIHNAKTVYFSAN